MRATGRIGDAARERILRESDVPAGTVVAGRFRLCGRLGGGGGGEVFVAEDLERGGRVALKLLAGGTGPQSEGAFERDPRLALRLDHPGLARIVALGTFDGRDWVASELVEGETLAERLRRGALPVDEATPLILDVLEALEYLHAAGVAHRDVKPGNVMLSPSGAKLLDYGLARRLGLPSLDGSEVWGTAEYLAPEQVRGEAGDHRADLYATSVLLWEALTGRPPFSGATPHETARMRASTLPEPPPDLEPRARGPLAVAVRGMAIDPESRFPSPRAMADALRRAAEGAAGERELQRALRDDADRLAGREAWESRVWRFALPIAIAAAIALVGLATWWLKTRPLP